MSAKSNITPNGWIALEINVLRRLKFASVAFPFSGEPPLGVYLKRWNVRVLTNDLMRSAQTKAIAAIQNNGEKLSADEVGSVLEDVYVPHYRLQNPALRSWFGETDAWWFDNLRQNIEKISSPVARAVALSLGMSVGDYVLSFTEDTLELRQPLSSVFQRLWKNLPEPIDNGQHNVCDNRLANKFIGDHHPDLMYLRLPPSRSQTSKIFLGAAAWREEWLRGGDDFWTLAETENAGKLGDSIETKSQYLRLVEDFLQTAQHIPNWAISCVESGFVSTQDIVETIGRVGNRRVNTIFTKDFSELTGTKAVIITA